MSLNGLWNCKLESVAFKAIQGLIGKPSMTEGSLPRQWDRKLLVPFAVDSPLSGVMHVLRPQERIWYERSLELPAELLRLGLANPTTTNQNRRGELQT